ncbi:MAG: hypothetical protein SVR94_08555 [Pseudomonadota bacterium]|nr:hypothetical protein [Pseudomonadota bacterium]
MSVINKNFFKATRYLLLTLLVIDLPVVAAESQRQDVAKPASVEQRWGVQPQAIRLTAAGYMLDFRYRVIDAQKARYLSDRNHQAYLLDQASGARFIVPRPPKVGNLRQTTATLKTNKTYFILFANPGRFIQPGRKVTVIIGDFKATDLIVE